MTQIGSNGTEVIQASFSQTRSLALSIMETLQREGSPLGYGILACALTISKLSNPGEELSQLEEIKFIQDLSEWVATYWGEGLGKAIN